MNYCIEDQSADPGCVLGAKIVSQGSETVDGAAAKAPRYADNGSKQGRQGLVIHSDAPTKAHDLNERTR